MVIKCFKELRILQFYILGQTLRIYTRLCLVNYPSFRQLILEVLDTQIYLSHYDVTHLTNCLIMAYITPKYLAHLNCSKQLCPMKQVL